MPIRRCGAYTIDVRFDFETNHYPVFVTHDGRRAYACSVKPGLALVDAQLRKNEVDAVDTPDPIDQVAHAAMSFFANDCWGAFDEALAERTEDGWSIRGEEW